MSAATTTMAIGVTALAAALAATPAARALARRFGFFDRPSARKTQARPVPLLGGLAIHGAVLLSMVAFGQHHLWELAAIVSGASVMALVGLIDDGWPLSSASKALAELAVVLAVMLAGARVELGWLPAWLNVALSLLWLLGITNALNLLDNMDGLAGGVSAIAAAFLTTLAIREGQYAEAALAAAVLGACSGFLVFNTRPASVFMGDAGSLSLGFLLAVLALELRFPGRPSTVTWVIPVLVLAVPILDTTSVVGSRLRRGVNPFTTPGHDHLSHRLVAAGLSPLAAVLTLYGAGVLGGLLAVVVATSGHHETR